jgi:hypothetical protein
MKADERKWLCICVFLCSSAAYAHEFYSTKLTWSRDVSRIFYRRCVSCHHESGSSFSLVKYSEARPWAKAIKEEVLNRRMPPWNAVKGFGDLYDDRSLTQEEISVISNWVEGGAPEGETIYLPQLPKFEDGMNAGPTVPMPSARVKNTVVVKENVELFGVMPSGVELNASVQLIAERPGGAMVPVIWILQANPDFRQIYYFNDDIPLPAGSKLLLIPPGSGNFVLYWKPAPQQSPAKRAVSASRAVSPVRRDGSQTR